MDKIREQIDTALGSSSQDSRWAAALALEGFADEKWASEQLENLRSDEDPFVRNVARRALSNHAGSALTAISYNSGLTVKSSKWNQTSKVPLSDARAFDHGLVVEIIRNHLASVSSLPVGLQIPQANSVDRIISVAKSLGTDSSLGELPWKAEISKRQVFYYRDAAIWLGILGDEDQKLRYLGAEIGIDSGKLLERFGAISGLLIRRHPVVKEAVAAFLRTGAIPKISVFTSLMETVHHQVSTKESIKMGSSTAKRRLDTARAWASWVTERIPPEK